MSYLSGTGLSAQTNNICTIKNNYILKPFDGPLTNPHKGFTFPTGGTWSFSSSWEYGPGGEKNNKAWDVVTYGCGYQRWDKLNPEKGVYDWTALDKLLDECEKHGMGYALRVFPYSSTKGVSSNYTVEQDYDWTPRFVYSEGARKGYATVTYNGNQYTVAVPIWDDPIYLQAHKDFAAALAKKYDGDPRIEYIDIRPFGNWGEWHASQLKGSEMPSEEVQKDMLSYYASVFHKTLLVLPSSGSGDVYNHALSLGIAKRDDGMIATPDREYTLLAAYEANLPTIGENLAPYSTMLNYNDIIPGGYLKWTLERWKKAITVPHLTYYVLDQDSDAGYRFYNDNKVHVDSMTKVIGYNFRILNADLLTITDSIMTTNTLNITVKNTGLASCFFDVYMVAELVDNAGNVLSKFGKTILIPKGSFKDEMSQDFDFVYSVSAGQTNLVTQQGVSVALSLYESEDDYNNGKNPTVRFDNDGIQENKKLLLTSCSHEYGNWDTLKVATGTEEGLRRHVCTRENCESYEEEIIPVFIAGLDEVRNDNDTIVPYALENSIYITNVKGKTVCLFNSSGELYEKKVANMNELQFSVQSKGVYFVMVNNKQYTVIVK
jgi:hypothetical protein